MFAVRGAATPISRIFLNVGERDSRKRSEVARDLANLLQQPPASIDLKVRKRNGKRPASNMVAAFLFLAIVFVAAGILMSIAPK